MKHQIHAHITKLREEAENATAYANHLVELLKRLETKKKPLNDKDRAAIRRAIETQPNEAIDELKTGLAYELESYLNETAFNSVQDFIALHSAPDPRQIKHRQKVLAKLESRLEAQHQSQEPSTESD